MMVLQSSTHGMADNSYPTTILTRLSEQRLHGLFCDVTIVVEDIKFRAHRNILAATSGFFYNVFTASDTCMSGQVLELPDLKSEVFASILNFMYSSKVESASTEHNKNFVAAGKRLGIPFPEKLLETPHESDQLENSSSPLKLSENCTLKNESQRLEEQDCPKGPRITNAFSITEVTASSNPFTPMNLSNNGHQSPDTNNNPSGCTTPGMPSVESDPTYAKTEPTRALSEHSYAVSQGIQTTDIKEASQLCNKGNLRPVVIQSETLTIQTIGPLKKRHRLCKGTASISKETKVSVQNPGRRTVVQNILPDPSPVVQSRDSMTGISSSPNLLPPCEVTSSQDADPPTLIPENINPTYQVASTYHCQQCPEAFSNLALLTNHTQVHKRRFVSHLFCKYCHKKFMHFKRLRNHEQVCVKGPPELEQNGKEDSISLDSNNRSRLDDSVFPVPNLQEPPILDPTLTCPLETPPDGITKSNSQQAYKCSKCKRAYVTLSSLKRHENVHSWQRAYPCHYCNKVFALAEYRTKHEIWHTGERRYQCIFCLETFMTYYILKNHQKSFHGIDPHLAVNNKSGNRGLKGSVYPIKLYRLLPMKFRKKRYKSYSQTYSEGISNHEQSFSDTLETNSPAASLEDTAPTVADNSIVGQSLFSMPVTFMATPKMVASEMPRITFDQPYDQNKELVITSDKIMSCTQQRGLHPTNTPRKNRVPVHAFEGTGSPVFSYGFRTSVATQENAGTSTVMHKNNSSNLQNNSDTNRDVLPFLNIPSVCSFEGLSKLSELSAAAQTIEAMANQLLLPRPEKLPQSLSPAGKTETYIAKPACPGPSVNSEVLPLCQITVKIGNEAIIRRKIKGSKLFPKTKKKRSWKKVEDESIPVQDGIGCPSLRLRAEVTTSVTKNEQYDDVNDSENDKLWRPYYRYKPKRKGKKLRSKQKRMKSVQFYTKPLSPEPDVNDLTPFVRNSEERISEASSEYRRQLRSHSPKEAFPCHSCSSSFSTPTSLSMHIVSCHQLHCKMCGKQCPLEELPNADVPFRDANGDFVCQSCTEDGSCFSSDVAACSLSSEKRYHCSYCPQRFLYLATKKSHEAKHLEKLNTGWSCHYSPKVCKSTALLSKHDNKHFCHTIGVRQLMNAENNVTAEPYSPVTDSKEHSQPDPWDSPEIYSPLTPKTDEPVDMETECFFPKTTHIFKKTSLSFCYKGNRPFSPLLPEMQRKKKEKKHSGTF